MIISIRKWAYFQHLFVHPERINQIAQIKVANSVKSVSGTRFLPQFRERPE